MKDIAIIPIKTTQDKPQIYDKTTDPGLMLLQQIMVLLLSNSNQLYRQDEGSALITAVGSNMNDDSVLQVLATNAISTVRSLLQQQDLQLISSLSAKVNNGQLDVQLVLTTGVKYNNKVYINGITG